MRNLASSFTMRKDGVLPRGDWFTFKNLAGDNPKVYIYDEIGFWGTTASDFVDQLNEITAPQMELHLNSPGGEIFDGLAIFNALKQHSARVTVYVDGLAASAASFIAQAGDEVIMARNAQMMIHDGIAFAYGNEQDMLDTAGLLSQLSNNIADIYAFAAAKRGFTTTEAEFRDIMRNEAWYNGKEAVAAGLADTITDPDEEPPTDKWDLSFYNFAGREKAESPLRLQEKIRLANRTKEKNMGEENPEETTPQGTDPEQLTGEPDEQGAEAQPQQDPVPPNETVTADQPETPAPQPTADNSAGQPGVLINGKMVTDWAVINQHFQSLNSAQEEQRTTFRKDFVEGLASSNKIPAPMVDNLIKLVNGDPANKLPAMSDEQFAAFQASYESAPASTLFGNHATTQSGQPTGQPQGVPSMTPDARQDRVNVLQGTVAMHRRTMPEDKVKNTPSYIELQQLLGQSNES